MPPLFQIAASMAISCDWASVSGALKRTCLLGAPLRPAEASASSIAANARSAAS
jgi:hypothetical protein